MRYGALLRGVIGITSVAVAATPDRRDDRSMERGQAEQASSTYLGSLMMFDEQEVLLRATWRPVHGFFNISLWRDGRVVETFHLKPEAAADLTSFFMRAFAGSVPAPRSQLRLVPTTSTSTPRSSARRLLTRTRSWLAESLQDVAQRLRP